MKIRKDFKIKKKIIILGVLIISRMSFFSVSHANNLGLENNKLLPCPKSPNCVLSQEGDEKHKIVNLKNDIKNLDCLIFV